MSNFDVLKPELVWLGERCYRKIPIRNKQVSIEEDDPYLILNHFEDDDYSDVPMKAVGENKFQTSLYIPCVLYSFLGKAVMVKIVRETKALVSHHEHDDSMEVIITGANKRSVGSAYQRIVMITDTARLNSEFTHFVSVPMDFKILKDSFLKFKQDVLAKCSEAVGLSEDLFQNPNKLHLTIATLALLDKRDQERATALFQDCRNTIRELLQGEPLSVMVKGIEYMNEDPSEVDVLYAKINDREENHFLQMIADRILSIFVEERLAVKQRSPSVKLHMTLMNTKFRSHTGPPNKDERRETFDARPIFEHFSNYEFGVVEVSEIHLSILYSTDYTRYYKAASILKIE